MQAEARIIREVSAKFSKIVREELAGDLPSILARNKTPEYKECCATHDFCDANDLMYDAFTAVYLDAQFDAEDETHCEIWSEAWDRSKYHSFAN